MFVVVVVVLVVVSFFSLWGVMFSAACPVAGDMTGGGGNAMIGPIGLYLLRFPGAVPHPKPPCEAGAAAGLVTHNVPPLLG